jgi:hypothetical protein
MRRRRRIRRRRRLPAFEFELEFEFEFEPAEAIAPAGKLAVNLIAVSSLVASWYDRECSPGR